MKRVVFVGVPETVIQETLRLLGTSRHSCAAASSVSVTEFATAGVEAIAFDAGAVGENVELVERAARASYARLIATMVPSRPAVADVQWLAHRVPSLHIAIRHRHNASESAMRLVAAMSDPDGGPVASALRMIAERLDRDGLALVITALALGRTRADVGSYAHALAMATRTIQATVRRVGIPSPHGLLLWGQALWAMWRLQYWNMTCKEAAAVGGFGNASRMAAALTGILHASPRRAAQSTDLQNLLERFRDEMFVCATRTDPLPRKATV